MGGNNPGIKGTQDNEQYNGIIFGGTDAKLRMVTKINKRE